MSVEKNQEDDIFLDIADSACPDRCACGSAAETWSQHQQAAYESGAAQEEGGGRGETGKVTLTLLGGPVSFSPFVCSPAYTFVVFFPSLYLFPLLSLCCFFVGRSRWSVVFCPLNAPVPSACGNAAEDGEDTLPRRTPGRRWQPTHHPTYQGTSIRPAY